MFCSSAKGKGRRERAKKKDLNDEKKKDESLPDDIGYDEEFNPEEEQLYISDKEEGYFQLFRVAFCFLPIFITNMLFCYLFY